MKPEDVIKTTTKRLLIRTVADYSPIMMSLYQHEAGTPLPSGQEYDPFRDLENHEEWESVVNELLPSFQERPYANRVSKTLLSQMAIMHLATINEVCDLKYNAAIDVMSKLEGISGYAPSTDLLKCNLSFDEGGMLEEYLHCHVNVVPNTYPRMLHKAAVRDKIARTYDHEKSTIDISRVEEMIKEEEGSSLGKMTGHWLIYKNINNKNYYLGLFPHPREKKYKDDEWIKAKCDLAKSELNI